MQDVFTFSDYREVLKSFYEDKKKESADFSFRAMSLRAGVKSSAFYKLVMEGKRNLSKSSVVKTAILMKLNKDESMYFENLVFFNQAQSIEEKNHFFARMVEAQKHRKISIIAAHQMSYFSEWYHPVIRELVAMPGFKEDYSELAKLLNPPITAQQAEGSVHLLIQLGFLIRKQGRLTQAEPSLSAGTAVSDFLILQYQIKMLKMAMESFDRVHAAQRLSSTTTLALPQSAQKKYFQRIREFRQEIQQMAETEKASDQVFALGIHFFPVSKRWS